MAPSKSYPLEINNSSIIKKHICIFQVTRLAKQKETEMAKIVPQHRLASHLRGRYTNFFLSLQTLLLLHLQTDYSICNSATRSLERALQVIGKSLLSPMPVPMPVPMPRKIQTRRKTAPPFRPAKRLQRNHSTPIPRSKFIFKASLNKPA